ncbi:ubiquitin carboxyl-terminal hydrolase Usp2 isoform X1 [Drosophila albomicans]|uniref:ubiquitinyl hydrolase 1 n=1 Tax=Drosophila albomicans TaxID=7291 RepID=A0A6P8Y0C2_DROAB|nr:ubiquitin carboxyl-terminal hydrolase Usp2 isoform X1 [Drosophila albomicans]
MMLDIKKNRGFHKIPASKLQREADNSQQQQQQRGNISQTQQQQQQQQQQKQQHGKAAVKQLNGIQSKQGAAATRSVVASSNGRATATSTTTTTTSNPVRAANQRYFLVSSYKDPSFLKAECDLAHAQVTHKSTPTTTTTTTTQAAKTTTTHKRNKTCDDHKNNNSNSKQLAIAGNIGLNDMRRPTTLNGNQAGGNSSNSTNSSSSNNASRTTTTTTTAIASNTTVHRIDIKYSHSNNSKSTLLASKAATTSSAAATAGATVSGAAIGRVVAGGKLKPLTLQCNNNHNAMNSHNSYNNNINNNSSSSNSNGSSSHNNNSNSMQRQQQQQQQHDDISYIDSDDTPPATAGAAATTATVAAAAATSSSQKVTTNSICYFKPITPPLQLRNNQQQQSSDKPLAQRSSVRPKSTIISSTNSNFAASYEKFNSYKHTNGERSKERDRDRDRDRDRERENSTARRYGIDSLSIKASIEKFNSLSEQKRQPTPMRHCSSGGNNSGGGGGNAASVAATTAAGSMAATATAAASAAAAAAITVSGGTGSSSNLQQRYCSSSDLENTRIAAGYTSSLTRAAYRTTANSTSTTANGGGGGTTAATMTTLASVAPISKSANRIAHGLLAKATSSSNASGGGSATDCAMIAVNNATVAATSSSSSGNNSSSNHKASRNVSSSSRSVLPPVSPTSSRYWDRDSTRSNSNATSSSIGSSSLSTKHNSSVDDGYKSSRDEKFEGTCGLRNIGNTCFMSSVIQCLGHTTELTHFLRQYNTSARLTRSTSRDKEILYEFAKLIQEMWTTNVNSVTPMGLKLAFSTKHRMYSDCSQQDAQEFLRFFLDSLHSALNTGTKGEPLNIDDNLSDNKKADLTWEWYSRNENSLIRDLFVGQLKSTLKCTSCSNTSVTFDPFWDLSVPLPSSSRCKLDACLDLFIREEVLDGDEMPTCSKCKTRRKCTKSLTIQRFPKYLVIHLKRFSETRWSKLSNMVEFPTGDRELNMASYGANPNSNVHYSLYAISNHMGSTVGGHYVAICKHPDSHKWHEFNDNIVSDALSESCLVSPSAYILFYERA